MAPPRRPGRIAFARSQRRDPTRPEKKLWHALRDRRLAELKFRRQVPIGPYVVDFCCFARRIVIEADGDQHCDSASDLRRDAWLRSQGFTVVRLWNAEILDAGNLLTETIAARLGIELV